MDKNQLDEIKSRVSIVDVVSSYVTLSKSGKNYKGLCPFHQENTPSFMVTPNLQIFKCFGCQKGGDIFTFIQEIEGLEFVDSVKYFADKLGIKLDIKEENKVEKDRKTRITEINNLASEYYHYILTKHKIGIKALEYLKDKRKLTDKTISDFKLGYAPNSWRNICDYLQGKKYLIEDLVAAGLVLASDKNTYYDRFRGRVVFPIRDISGNVVGFTGRSLGDEEPKYLNTPETEVFHKGKILFGLDRAKSIIKREGLSIVVEGQMDVISAHQAGIANTVASSGTALTVDQLETLKKFTKDVAFCFDTDFAGLDAALRGIELAESLGLNVRVVVVPKPFKDLDDCIREDPEGAKLAIESARSVYDFYFTVALNRFSVSDSLGKKSIADFLVPVVKIIKNPVLKEHYVKRLAKELETSEESILLMVNEKNEVGITVKGNQASSIFTTLKGIPLQEYILTLVLKAPLDTASSTLYKLGQRDFTEPTLERIFVELKEHLLGRKKRFEVSYFCDKISKLDNLLSDKVKQLYLRDTGELTEQEEELKKELQTLVERIKNEAAKRELKTLANKIKGAEASGDMAEVKRLSSEFKNVSERLK